MLDFDEFARDLRKRGYSVKRNVSICGKSGAVHHVDFLMEDKRNERKKIIGIEKHCKQNLAFEIINTFTIAYDTNSDACYIVDRELEGEEKKLAEDYKIVLLSQRNTANPSD